jgi:tetratricopeptide (TPR) repeat protein
MLAGEAEGGLPARLAELLVARAGRCGEDGRAVLAALAVAGRPLAEDQLCRVSGLGAEAVRRGLRQLAAARLLAEAAGPVGHRPRHALLAEAVAADMLPGERVALHERTARLLEAAGDDSLAAEAASHWAAAGRGAEDLPARVAAAGAAERVFGYAEAAAHYERAIELAQAQPAADGIADAGLPGLFLRAIDAAVLSGDTRHASVLAEEAYRRFASHPDHATAAVIHQRAGYLRGLHTVGAGGPLMEKALELFELCPPSAEHAEALLRYARTFLQGACGRQEDNRAALTRALEIAEAAGATGVIPRILVRIPPMRRIPALSRRCSPNFTARGRSPRRPGMTRPLWRWPWAKATRSCRWPASPVPRTWRCAPCTPPAGPGSTAGTLPRSWSPMQPRRYCSRGAPPTRRH